MLGHSSEAGLDTGIFFISDSDRKHIMEIISYHWEESSGFCDFSVEQSLNEGRSPFILVFRMEGVTCY